MAQEKTEEPTPKRLLEARGKGEVARSRELGTAIVLLAGALGLLFTGELALDAFRACWFETISAAGQMGTGAPSGAALLAVCSSEGARLVMPLLAILFVCSALVAFAQVGPLWAPRALGPDPGRLDPLANLGRILDRRSLVELVKALLILLAVGVTVTITLSDSLGGIIHSGTSGAGPTLVGAGALMLRVLTRVAALMLLLGVLDLVYQRLRFRRERRMTQEEVRREHREAEGEPHAKRERQRMHREIAEHGVLEEVRRADVLVVNPTHLAIALRYDANDEEDGAPEVLAKGQDHLARRMIEAARESGVPVMRDVPLARGLFELEVGAEIPEILYEAAAAVLQAAWREREESA